MAFADPQSITVNGVAKSMPRVETRGMNSLYSNTDSTFTLRIVHEPFKRDKKARIKSRMIFTQRKVVADPLTAVSDWEDLPISLQIDRPEVGFSEAEVDQMVQGLKTALTTAVVGQLVGRQS